MNLAAVGFLEPRGFEPAGLMIKRSLCPLCLWGAFSTFSILRDGTSSALCKNLCKNDGVLLVLPARGQVNESRAASLLRPSVSGLQSSTTTAARVCSAL